MDKSGTEYKCWVVKILAFAVLVEHYSLFSFVVIRTFQCLIEGIGVTIIPSYSILPS